MVSLAVGLVFMNSVLWHLSLALVLSRPTVQRAYLRHFRSLNKAAGLMVGAMGLKLIVTTIQELRK